MKSPRELVSEFLYGDPKAYESKALMWNKQTHVVSAADVEELVKMAVEQALAESLAQRLGACMRAEGYELS